MDYIVAKLNENINLEENWALKFELYQIKIRYYICILLSEKINNIPEGQKNVLIVDLKVPVENSLINWLKTVGVDEEIVNLLHKYRSVVRNNKAHNFTLTDDKFQEYCEGIDKILKEIEAYHYPLINDNYALYYVDKDCSNNGWSGIYMNVSKERNRMTMPRAFDLKLNHLYLVKQCNGIPSKDSIVDISAMVDADSKLRDIYVFLRVEDEYIGNVLYCNIETSEEVTKTKEEFVLKSETRSENMATNGFVHFNLYQNNYQEFIKTPYIEDRISKIESFLKDKDEHLILLRGNGGVGKTAIVQELLEKNKRIRNKKDIAFQYIIFLSAKKFKFNHEISAIEKIAECSNNVSNLKDIKTRLKEFLGKTMDDEVNLNNKRIILVIDDCESFNPNEVPKIVEFFKINFNGYNQKVIFTCRNVIEEVASIYIDNLDKINMVDFMEKSVVYKLDDKLKKVITKVLEFEENIDKIHNITNHGNTLMILYYIESFKYVYANENRILLDIDEGDNLFNFLHKKIAKWLEPREKTVAAVLGLVFTSDNLSSDFQKVQYILYGGRPSSYETNELKDSLNELAKREVLTYQLDEITLRDVRFVDILKDEYTKLIINNKALSDNWNSRKKIIWDFERIDEGLLSFVNNNIDKYNSNITVYNNLFKILFEYEACSTSVIIKGLKMYSLNIKENNYNVLNYIKQNEEYFKNISIEDINNLDYFDYYATVLIENNEYDLCCSLLKNLFLTHKNKEHEKLMLVYVEKMLKLAEVLIVNDDLEEGKYNNNIKLANQILEEEFKRSGNIEHIMSYVTFKNNHDMCDKIAKLLEELISSNLSNKLSEKLKQKIEDELQNLIYD